MGADPYTKNLPGPLFGKHGSSFYGKDEYYVNNEAARASRGKAKPGTNFSSDPRMNLGDLNKGWVWNQIID